MHVVSLLLVSFLLLSVPSVGAQSPPEAPTDIDALAGRLPEQTVLYLRWKNLGNFKQLRASNSLLRFLDSPEMKSNWRNLKAYYEEQQAAEHAAKGSPSTEVQPEPALDLHDLFQLLPNPGLLALVSPEDEPAPSKTPPPLRVLYLYDMNGMEQQIADLEKTLAKSGTTTTTVTIDGVTVLETTDPKGKPVDYRARVGRWLVGGDNRALVEVWIASVQNAPERSLARTDAYLQADALRSAGGQVEFFLSPAAGAAFLRRSKPPGPKDSSTPTVQLQSLLGLEEWTVVLGTMTFQTKETRYDLAALHKEGAGNLAGFLGPAVTDFPSLQLAPVNVDSYSVAEIDVSAIWRLVDQGMTTLLPPQQSRLAAGFVGMVEGVLGMPIADLASAWGPEFAQFSYPSPDETTHSVKLVSLRRPDVVEQAMDNLMSAFGSQLNFEKDHDAESRITYFRFQVPAPESGEDDEPQYSYLALHDGWLLTASSKADIQEALGRAGGKDSLQGAQSFQEARSRFPSSLCTFSYVDAERWLKTGALDSFLQGMAQTIVNRGQQEKEAEEVPEQEGEPEAEHESSDGPTLKNRQAGKEQAAPAEDEVPPPKLQIPQGYLKWILSATSKDARGIYHTGYVE